MNRTLWGRRWLVVTSMITFFGLVSAFSAQGPGKGNIKVGALEVHTSIGLTETYNDNIYKNYGNLRSESDWITTLTPGIQFSLPLQRHSFQVDYRADVNWFSSNSNTNYTNQRVGGAVNLDFPGGLIFKFSDYYSDAIIPRKAKTGNNSSSDPYRDLPYTSNDLNIMGKYRFVDRWAVEARYNNYDYAYKNSYDQGGNYKRDLYGGSLYYRFTSKMDAVLDYNFGKTTYKTTSTNNNNEQSIYLGLSFDPTSKLQGYAKLGWTQKDYDITLTGRNNSFSGISSLIDLTYSLSRYDGLTFKGNRTIQEDVDSNAPFINTDFSLWYRHVLAWNEKVSLNANAGYGTGKFEQSTTDIDGTVKTRDDKRLYAGAGIAYAIQRWLTLGVNYSYTDNNSNFLNYKYKENKVWFNATAAF